MTGRVNIVDAVTWDRYKNFDYLWRFPGEFSPKGGEMFVASADMRVGGLSLRGERKNEIFLGRSRWGKVYWDRSERDQL